MAERRLFFNVKLNLRNGAALGESEFLQDLRWQWECDARSDEADTNQNFGEIGRDKRGDKYMLFDPLRPYGLAVRTPPFHGGSPGSIPGRVAIFPPFPLLNSDFGC